MASTALSIVCLIIELIVLVFLVLSIGLDVLRVKGSVHDAYGCALAAVYLGSSETADCKRVCFGMWGVKHCGPHKPDPQGLPLWGYPTKEVRRLANCASAFDIISAVVALVAFILTILLACRCMSAWVVVALYVVVVITAIIAIGCLLGIYYYNAADSLGPVLATLDPVFSGVTDLKLKKLFNLFSAAALIVCGWCLQVINLILMIINACCCGSSSSSSPTSSSSSDKKSSEHGSAREPAHEDDDDEL